MLLEGLVLGALWGWARGGRVAELRWIHLHTPGFFLAALLVQEAGIAAVQGGWWPAAWFWAIQVLALCLLGVGLWYNRRIPGMTWLLVGAAMNAAAIAWYGGRMPVATWALTAAGLEQFRDPLAAGTWGKHLLATEWAPGLWLGDIIPLRPPYYPLHRVASPGDMVQMFGVARLFATYMMNRQVSCGSGGERAKSVSHDSTDHSEPDPGGKEVSA